MKMRPVLYSVVCNVTVHVFTANLRQVPGSTLWSCFRVTSQDPAID